MLAKRSPSWFVACCTLAGQALVMLIAANQHVSAQSTAKRRINEPEICGPRVVHYILRHYGKKVELRDLVSRMAFAGLENGSTLQEVDNALQKEGVYTYLLPIGKKARLQWPHPVVVHYIGGSAGQGHFVVWLPSSTAAEQRIWSGLSGELVLPSHGLYETRSPAVLLTSPTVIISPKEAIAEPAYNFYFVVAGVFGVMAALVLVRLIVTKSRTAVPVNVPTGECSDV